MVESDTHLHEIVGVILAGGQGSRVSGADKGLLDYQGKPLIEWVVEAIKPQVSGVVLSVNRNVAAYQSLGLRLIVDHSNKDQSSIAFNGPMAGIATAIKELGCAENAAFLISSCDSPHLPNNYVQKLSDALQRDNADVAVVHDGERQQNLHCLIDTGVALSIVEQFEQGERAMHRWFNSVKTVSVDFSDQAECFNNINTSEQLNQV